VYCSLEPVLWVSSVGDGACAAIRIQNCVLTLYDISITSFLVVLRVARQRILNAIRECIVWFSLRKKAKDIPEVDISETRKRDMSEVIKQKDTPEVRKQNDTTGLRKQKDI
jgi:hypothetical protein